MGSRIHNMKTAKWFDRKFELGLTLDSLPNLSKRLRGTPKRLEELVMSIPPNIMTRKIGPNWSIQEQVGHLWDLEELHIGRIDDFKSKVKVLRPADLNNRRTEQANHNANSLENLLSSFRSARKILVDALERLDEQTLSHLALHPRLQKPMSPVDMAFFIAEHDDHHLGRITEIYRELRKSGSSLKKK